MIYLREELPHIILDFGLFDIRKILLYYLLRVT